MQMGEIQMAKAEAPPFRRLARLESRSAGRIAQCHLNNVLAFS